jgi:hypothetical protein
MATTIPGWVLENDGQVAVVVPLTWNRSNPLFSFKGYRHCLIVRRMGTEETFLADYPAMTEEDKAQLLKQFHLTQDELNEAMQMARGGGERQNLSRLVRTCRKKRILLGLC